MLKVASRQPSPDEDDLSLKVTYVAGHPRATKPESDNFRNEVEEDGGMNLVITRVQAAEDLPLPVQPEYPLVMGVVGASSLERHSSPDRLVVTAV